MEVKRETCRKDGYDWEICSQRLISSAQSSNFLAFGSQETMYHQPSTDLHKKEDDGKPRQTAGLVGGTADAGSPKPGRRRLSPTNTGSPSRDRSPKAYLPIAYSHRY
jgi:hypothetical protein